jgi:hypothetical protein
MYFWGWMMLASGLVIIATSKWKKK